MEKITSYPAVWAGLDERCEWCALFVSWCGDQTGLRASGQIPYFSFVSDGVDWFKDKGKWIDGSEINNSNYDKRIYSGMIIFFDWEPDGNEKILRVISQCRKSATACGGFFCLKSATSCGRF